MYSIVQCLAKDDPQHSSNPDYLILNPLSVFKEKPDHGNKLDLVHLPTGLLIELGEDFGEEDRATAVGEKAEGDFTGGG